MHGSGFASGLLDPQGLITSAGPWGLAIVCAFVFVETGLLVGFVLPGDTLLFFAGLLTFTGHIAVPLWVVILSVIVAAVVGDQLGYAIGRTGGPAVFERRESGIVSRASVRRTEVFFARFGPASVTLARFVPVVRTFAPVAAGIARMRYTTFLLYNVLGAVAWSSLVILLGYFVGHIPGVAGFVSSYIDLVLVGIVVISVLPVAIRALVGRHRARDGAAAGTTETVRDSEPVDEGAAAGTTDTVRDSEPVDG